MRRFPFLYHPWGVLILCGLLAVAGCKPSVKLVPVTGKVKVGGRPLSKGVVLFAPEAATENTNRLLPTGAIKADGSYELYTQGKAGAPLGRYKIVVSVPDEYETDNKEKKPLPSGAPTRRRVNRKYSNPDTSPLVIEVVESPQAGAYDLTLSNY